MADRYGKALSGPLGDGGRFSPSGEAFGMLVATQGRRELTHRLPQASSYQDWHLVQKSSSPDDALANLDRAEALGLPPTEKKLAEDLRPQILYAVVKIPKIFEGTWLYSKQNSQANGGTHSVNITRLLN